MGGTLIPLVADALLVAGVLGATLYCYVLSRRLKRFNDLERGVGGAVAVLSAQVDDMTKALIRAEGAANDSTGSLNGLTQRAEDVAGRLELLVASFHDFPSQTTDPALSTAKEKMTRKDPAEDDSSEARPATFVRHSAVEIGV